MLGPSSSLSVNISPFLSLCSQLPLLTFVATMDGSCIHPGYSTSIFTCDHLPEQLCESVVPKSALWATAQHIRLSGKPTSHSCLQAFLRSHRDSAPTSEYNKSISYWLLILYISDIGLDTDSYCWNIPWPLSWPAIFVPWPLIPGSSLLSLLHLTRCPSLWSASKSPALVLLTTPAFD